MDLMQAEEPLDPFGGQGLDDVLALPCPGDEGREVEAEIDCALVTSELGVLSQVCHCWGNKNSVLS